MAEGFVGVAVKPVAPVLAVDWATGRAELDHRHLVRTAADAAACAVGRRLAAELGTTCCVVAVAGPSARGVLLELAAEGADRVVRVVVGDDADTSSPDDQWGSDVVAGALATVLLHASVVVCGDASGDRGSGTVPSLLAHRLGRAQGLCLRAASVDGGRVLGARRLDGGRRERLALDRPCVVSVEAGAAAPPRSSLAAVLAADLDASRIELVSVDAPAGARRGDPAGTRLGPYRPRPSDVAPPSSSDPVRRAIELAGSLQAHEPPEVLRLEPAAAARALLERLERWGLR